MEPKVPVFKSDDISSTKSKEQVNHFVNVKKSSPASSITSTLKAPKDSEKKKALLARLKQARLKILLVLAAAVLIIFLIIFLPPFIKHLQLGRETDSLVEKTNGYIDAFRAAENSTKPKSDDDPETEPEYDGEDFDSLYTEISDYLNSDASFHNDEKNLKLSKSLISLARTFDNMTIYREVIETFKTVLPRIESEKTKAELELLLAELYYTCNQKVEACEHRSAAISLNPAMGDLSYFDEMSGRFMDMYLYCQGGGK